MVLIRCSKGPQKLKKKCARTIALGIQQPRNSQGLPLPTFTTSAPTEGEVASGGQISRAVRGI